MIAAALHTINLTIGVKARPPGACPSGIGIRVLAKVDLHWVTEYLGYCAAE